MKKTKKLGIWMDHASGHLMEFSPEEKELVTIESRFTPQVRQHSLNNKGEFLMHNKEHKEQTEYYNKIGEKILNYDEVIIFGPTDAKTELYNLLSKDLRFKNIKMDIKQTDKLTENQQLAFVNDYFSKH